MPDIREVALDFTNGLSGGVARTLLAQGAEMLSIVDFGGVGDGATDCTDAVNAALAALAGDRTSPPNHSGWGLGTIYFPKGQWLINGTVAVASPIGVRFFGDGEWATSIIRTADTGIMFDFSTYIAMSFEGMSFVHDPTSGDRGDWTNILFSLDGTGGGRQFRLEKCATKNFGTIFKYENNINGDTNFVQNCHFDDCTTFCDSENTQAVLNSYRHNTWVGAIQNVFHVAGHASTIVANANVVIDGTLLTFKNVPGKNGRVGFTFINTKLEWTAAHNSEISTPKILSAVGPSIDAHARFIDCSLFSGGESRHANSRFATIDCSGMTISFDGGEIEGLLDLSSSTGLYPYRGNLLRFRDMKCTDVLSWIFDGDGTVGDVFPNVVFENVRFAAYESPLDFTYAKFAAPAINAHRVVNVGPPNRALSGTFADYNYELQFLGQTVLVNSVKFWHKSSSTESAKNLYVYSDAARSNLIGSAEIAQSGANATVIDLEVAANVIVTEGLFFTIDVGTASWVYGHFICDYNSVS